MTVLLEVQNLETRFETHDGTVYAVNGVSFVLNQGETLGVVGESGSGKSQIFMSIMGLLATNGRAAGEVLFHGQQVLGLPPEKLNRIRGARMSMIFQDPMTSLNPYMRVQDQLTEVLTAHQGKTRKEALEIAIALLERVRIPDARRRISLYPHEFSGGMRQRVMIAMALSCNPQILIADEPTTALDVTIQAQITELVKRLRDELGMAVIWITHDLGVVAGIAQRVIVMYGGYIIEEAPVNDLYASPEHPYTLALINSLPRVDAKGQHHLESIEGMPPVLYSKSTSCPFAPRCKFVQAKCWNENPPLLKVGTNHTAACWVDTKTGKLRQ